MNSAPEPPPKTSFQPLVAALTVVNIAVVYLVAAEAFHAAKPAFMLPAKGLFFPALEIAASALAALGTGFALVTSLRAAPVLHRIRRESAYHSKKHDEAMELLKREREQQDAIYRERVAPVERKNQELQRRLLDSESQARPVDLLSEAVRSANDVIMLTEAEPGMPPRIVRVNPAFERMTGYTEREILRQSPRILQGADTDRETLQFLKNRLSEIRERKNPHDSVQVELLNYRKDGTTFWVELNIRPILHSQTGEITHWMSIQRDVTQRREAEKDRRLYVEQVEWQANHDTLTGLYNRAGYQKRLGDAIEAARRTKNHVGVLFFDVDRFKHINDTLGHIKGDDLLKDVSKRLKSCVDEQDVIARMGGDEFTLLLPSLKDVRQAEAVAARILDVLHRPFKVGGHSLFITASIGISASPQDGTDVDTLLKNADVALYRAKDEGRDRFRVFHPTMNDRAAERLNTEIQLRTALKGGEFYLLYQPQVDLQTGRVYGVEALVRWQNALLGKVNPGQFIPLAEETGLIVPIGTWILREACWQAAQWQKQGKPLRMSVNLSGRQLKQSDLVEIVQTALTDMGLEAKWLDLELTEGMIMEAHNMGVLTELKKLGVHLSVDDFGTGYSNLHYLTRLPLDILKIDRAFVTPLGENRRAEAMVRFLINMAHENELEVIAEGVETESQREPLRTMHCNAMQGFLFSPPVTAAEVERLAGLPVRAYPPIPAVEAAPKPPPKAPRKTARAASA